MIFKEKKEETGYVYEVEDIFGIIKIESNKQVDAEILDEITMSLLRQNIQAEEISGEDRDEDTGLEIKYTFKKTPMWEEPEQAGTNI
jgi:hypothetical protein